MNKKHLFLAAAICGLIWACSSNEFSEFQKNGELTFINITKSVFTGTVGNEHDYIDFEYQDSNGRVYKQRNVKFDGGAEGMRLPACFLKNDPNKIVLITPENMSALTKISPRPIELKDIIEAKMSQNPQSIMDYLNKNVSYGWFLEQSEDMPVVTNHAERIQILCGPDGISLHRMAIDKTYNQDPSRNDNDMVIDRNSVRFEKIQAEKQLQQYNFKTFALKDTTNPSRVYVNDKIAIIYKVSELYNNNGQDFNENVKKVLSKFIMNDLIMINLTEKRKQELEELSK